MSCDPLNFLGPLIFFKQTDHSKHWVVDDKLTKNGGVVSPFVLIE